MLPSTVDFLYTTTASSLLVTPASFIAVHAATQLQYIQIVKQTGYLNTVGPDTDIQIDFRLQYHNTYSHTTPET